MKLFLQNLTLFPNAVTIDCDLEATLKFTTLLQHSFDVFYKYA